MTILFYILLFLFGICLGSFLCCQARRLHLRTTAKKGNKSTKLNSRSICLHCHQQLKWYDNIPIISWLALRGKCRYCHQKIGIAELISELGTGIVFAGIVFAFHQSAHAARPTISPFGTFPPQDLASSFPTIGPLNFAILIVMIILALIFIFLAIYDGLYGELPSLCLYLAIVCSLLIVILRICSTLLVSSFTPTLLTDPLFATVILGGLYLVLYLVSKGKWVGDGDWLLATPIALALGTPWLALIVLFLANIIACIIMYPSVRHRHSHKVHFGPFLVTAFILTLIFSNFFTTLISS